MGLSWTKSWTSSDDGTVLGGADLGNIQGDIDSQAVLLGGTQTLTGDKTFTGDVIVRDPYVDVRSYGALGDGVTDDTSAIDTALATGKNVFFPSGIYMTTGGHRIATKGQKVFGAGSDVVGPNQTVIKKLSGTNYILDTDHGKNGIVLRDMTFDRNDLNGDGVRWRGHYSEIKNVHFKYTTSTGTGVDLYISGANVSVFNRITGHKMLIDQSTDSYTPKPSYGCLYSSFNDLYFFSLEIAGAQAQLLIFNKLMIENISGLNSLYIHGTNCANLFFNELLCEHVALTEPLIFIQSATAYNIRFSGGRILTNVAQTDPIFYVDQIEGFTIEKMHFSDGGPNAGRVLIDSSSILGMNVENNIVTSLNNFVFVADESSKYVSIRGNRARTTVSLPGTGTNTFASEVHLVIENDEFTPTIASSATYVNVKDVPSIHSLKSVGVITVADDASYDVFGDGGVTSPGANFMGVLSIQAGAVSATSLNNFATLYIQTSNTTATQLNVPIIVGSNVEVDNLADNTAASLAATTDGKLGIQIGGGATTTRCVRIYNRTGASVSLRVHVDRYEGA